MTALRKKRAPGGVAQEASAGDERAFAPATSIVVRLLATHNLLLGALREGLGAELSLARFDLLMQLDRRDGQTLVALSRQLLVTAGNLTGLVQRAERDGLVERRPDAADRRLTRVHLTARGQRLAAQAIRAHAQLAERILSPLEERERADLRRLLGRVRAVLEGRSTRPKLLRLPAQATKRERSAPEKSR